MTAKSVDDPVSPSPLLLFSPSRLPPPITLLLLAATAVLAYASAALAEEPTAKSAAEAGAIHNVLIPMDAKEKPVGDKYYVPEDLFGRLQRLATILRMVPGQSSAPHDHPADGALLIHEASYHGTMAWHPSGEELVLEELKATLDLEVFAQGVRVRIPAGGGGVLLAPQGPLLEGRAIRAEWSDADGRLSFDVADPGRYRLELPFRPTPRSGAASTFDMKIPPVAVARLELAVPRDAPAIEVPSARGAVVREGNPPQVTAQLGPADRLTIRWQEGAARGPAAAPLEVEQLLWLKVQPGSVVLDTLLKFKAVEESLREFRVVTDPRLRLLPWERDRGPSPRVETLAGQPQVLRFELPPAAPEQWVVQASFLLTDHPGVGSLRLPYCDVRDARTTRRWLAVSVDPRLEHQEQLGTGLQTLAVKSFLSAWGEAKGRRLPRIKSPRRGRSGACRCGPSRPH